MVNRRHAKPRRDIALHLRSEALMIEVLDTVRKRDWTPLDLTLTGAGSLSRIAPVAAIVDHLAEDSLEWEALVKAGCPMVRLDRSSSRQSRHRVPSVERDRAAEGRLAAAHFVDRGFTSVGYVGFDPWGGPKELHAAFRDAALELGCTFRLLRFPATPGDASEWDRQIRYENRLVEFKAWIEASPTPIGLLAWGAKGGAVQCEMCLHLGYEVPDEVAILAAGFDSPRCACAPVPLSNIGVDTAAMVATAFGMLDDLLAGRQVPAEAARIPPQAITCRESTHVLAVRDRDVARALRFIRNHYDMNLGVGDIVAAAGVPARSLRRAFQQELGRGLNAELRRYRLERACELLRSTKLPSAAIAPLAGFETAEYFHNAFRRACGITPRQYRRREAGSGGSG